MEDSFRGRVDKIFGSLSSSNSRPSIAAPLWSLTDDEVERREWNRGKHNPERDDQIPCSSSFEGLFTKDRNVMSKTSSRNVRNKLDDPSDDDDDGDEDRGFASGSSQRPTYGEEDDWDVRSSIGLDCTLDNEEEEDAYDIMAEGRENIGERMYMKDATDHGPYLNSYNVLPRSVDDSPNEPRVNHHAAKIRLHDDETLAEKLESNQAYLESTFNTQEPCPAAGENIVRVKSILKRKTDTEFKSSKRVKFDASCKEEYEHASEKYEDTLAGSSLTEAKTRGEDFSVRSRVPDYILNPSKYTRYSFDSNDIDDEANIQACIDLLGHIRNSNPRVLEKKSQELSAEHQKSVIFIPRKKASDYKSIDDGSSEGMSKQSLTQTSSSIGIAVGEVQQDEICVMQDDEPDRADTCTNATFQKPGRRYRTKSAFEDTGS